MAELAAGAPRGVAAPLAVLNAAAARGEAEALRHLATLAAASVGGPADFDAALDLLARAAAAGSASARGQLMTLAPQGAQGAAPDADPWLALRRAVDLGPWTAPCDKRVLNADPRTVAVPGFIPADVCAWLTGLAAGRLARARTFAADGSVEAAARGRTNSALELTLAECDVVVMLLRARIAASIGVPAGALETSQILRYAPGEEYARHFDFLDPALADVAAHGQRIVTFLVYLNDGFDGGETDFPRLGLRHKGAAGGALYFANLDPSGGGDPRTLHAGLPPTRGEKWLFSQWVRNRARV
jgi:prolyl 4-hydroxylase